MKFLEEIEKERFNQFVANHPKGHVLQASEWGELKSIHEWKMHRVGLEENGELVATAMLLSRNLPVIHKPIIYSPRGFVIDYKNEQYLEAFTKGIEKFAKKMGAIFVKIDPDIKHRERDIEGEVIEGGEDNRWLIDTMKRVGYTHKGFELDFNGIQPRFCFRLNIDRPEEEIFQQFHEKTRYNVRIAMRKGIEIIEGNRDDLVKFTEIMKVTGERDGFITRPLKYFQEMYDTLVPAGQMKLFLAKYNLNTALAEIEADRSKASKELEKLNKINIDDASADQKEKHEKKRADLAEKLQKLNEKWDELSIEKEKHPDGIIVSGAITLLFGKMAWYLYGASDNIYRNLMPNYLIQWEMIRWAKANGATVYDFRGISGDLSPEHHLYGLYRFKKGFNGEFTEFIGEFDLIINKPLYYAWEVLLPKFKQMRRNIRKVLQGK